MQAAITAAVMNSFLYILVVNFTFYAAKVQHFLYFCNQKEKKFRIMQDIFQNFSYNNMRRYVLLSLAYRFSLTPKKK